MGKSLMRPLMGDYGADDAKSGGEHCIRQMS